MVRPRDQSDHTNNEEIKINRSKRANNIPSECLKNHFIPDNFDGLHILTNLSQFLYQYLRE